MRSRSTMARVAAMTSAADAVTLGEALANGAAAFCTASKQRIEPPALAFEPFFDLRRALHRLIDRVLRGEHRRTQQSTTARSAVRKSRP